MTFQPNDGRVRVVINRTGWLAPRRLLQNNVELRRTPALLTNQSGALSLVETFIELKYFHDVALLTSFGT